MNDIKKIEFFLPCDPPTATAQERKAARMPDGRIRMYNPPAVKAAKKTLETLLMRYRPKEPLKGPLILVTEWGFRAKSHKPRTWRDTRPDTDNLQKLLKDCMTRCGFWEDDAQVCCEMVSKYWIDVPGISIRIAPATDDMFLSRKEGRG